MSPFGMRIRAMLPTRGDWARPSHRTDLIAGATVAMVALPLALAFGVASGLGARAGLITAIVAGAAAAIFGGSDLQITGPTGAMTVVLIPVVHRYGPDGVLMVGLMAGAILLAASFSGIGRAARHLPVPVVEGFTAGIAVVIVLQQVPAMLGTAGTGDKAWQSAADAVRIYLAHPRPAPLAIAAAVAALILVGARWRPSIPVALAAVALASAVSAAAGLPVEVLGRLPTSIPHPSLAFVDPGAISALLPSALAVAALGALESLLSATVADGMGVARAHDPDRELFGQGIANIASPLFGGVPATGAIARTAVNARAGATSRLSALMHAATLAIVVLIAAPLVAHIPVAALAGVLLATCIQMVQVGSLTEIARSTRGDAAILALTLGVTVLTDLVTAVAVGIAIAVVIALRSVARSARLEPVPLDLSDHLQEEHDLLAEHIVAYRLDGPLFFAAAHRFLLALAEVADIKVVILRLSRVTSMDATGARVLGDAIAKLEARGIVVLLSGIRADHDRILSALSIAEHLRESGRVFADSPSAIAYARGLVTAERGPA